MGHSNELSCEVGNFSHHLNPTVFFFFSQRLCGSVSPHWNLELPGLSHSLAVSPTLSAYNCGTACSACCHLAQSDSHHLSMNPLCPSCPSPLLLLVWMNVSSLTPGSSDFHTVQFPVSSGCFLFLNLLLSLFWLCEEAQSTYLHLHLGWKS